MALIDGVGRCCGWEIADENQLQCQGNDGGACGCLLLVLEQFPDGKIRGKAQSTRGFFLAANGFDNDAVNKFSGDAPRVVLMTGEDLAVVLDGRLPFFDVMRAKIDAIVRYGNINFSVRGGS